MLRAADAIVAISDSTAADVERILRIPGSRIHVVGGGVSDWFCPADQPAETTLAHLRAAVPRLQPNFILYTGGIDFRKNLECFITGVSRLSPRLLNSIQVVIACAASFDDRKNLEDFAERVGVDLLMAGWVTDEVLRDLYRTCRVFAFPSRYEGFGLPVAEALSCGAVVVVGDNSSLRELVEDRAARFDADDPDAIAETLALALTDEAFRSCAEVRAQNATFSWDRVAEATLPAYESAVASMDRRTTMGRSTRFAVVTPYPPQPSGIAEHSRYLIDALPPSVGVDIFVDGDPSILEAPRAGAVVHPMAALDAARELRRFDRELICIGNSEFHVSALDALIRRRGEVFLHDIRLTSLYWCRAHAPFGEPFPEALRRMYMDRLPQEVADLERVSDLDAHRLGIRMLRDVIAFADRIWVQSRFAQAVVRSEAAGHGIDCPPVEVVSFPFPDRFSATDPNRIPGLIVSMGVVSSVKHCDRVVEALSLLRQTVPYARLAFVGPVGEDEEAAILDRAEKLGVGDRIALTGPVRPDVYAEWLLSADVAVQLREVSNGEGSFTAAEAMANGVPVVVSRVGWCGELPDDAVEKCPVGGTPADLAARLERLITGPENVRHSMVRAARDYAAQRTFREMAKNIIAAGKP